MRIIKLAESLRISDEVNGLYSTAGSMPLSSAVSDLASVMAPHGIKWALCGGLALGVHARPRGTNDVDIVLKDESEVEQFIGFASSLFKKTREHAMVHRRTGVEVECLSPQFLKINPGISSMAVDTANGSKVGNAVVPVVSREGLVAMKLCRGSDYDRGDIKSIIAFGGDVNLDGWPIDQKATDLFNSIKSELSSQHQLKDKT